MAVNHCPSTTALSDREAAAALIAAGLASDTDEAAKVLAGWYGRKMCAEPTCRGAVLRTAKGIRKHVPGSNLTDAERAALQQPRPLATPRQLPGMARLMPLTPELIAHYSDAPQEAPDAR